MIKRIAIDSTVALDQEGANQNFEEMEARLTALEAITDGIGDLSGGRTIQAVVQGETITRMRKNTHTALKLTDLYIQAGDSVKDATKISVWAIRGFSPRHITTLELKDGERAGKIQMADLKEDIMIREDHEIEIRPEGTRRVLVGMTFEGADLK